jgi:hypothetical protein
MPDPEFNHARPAEARDTTASPSPPRFPHVICRNCNADLTSLPAVARFCNRCGVALSAETFNGPGPTRSSRPRFSKASGPSFSRPRWLYNLWFACVDCDTGIAHSASAGRSAVLLAYGKSLFNLGWRYEHAVGARRNLTEAARCYWKAARLGDPSAAGRLDAAPAAASPDPSPTACPLS